VRLVSDRRYRFTASPEAFWRALESTDRYQQWWPWLRQFEAKGLILGDSWRCAVRPPLPYTVRFAIELTEVDPPTTVAATITGDITGAARIEIAPDGDEGSTVNLHSELAPNGRGFTAFATVARPLVTRGHNWVLDTGAAQFGRPEIHTT
jgi:uncharacterized protein YndB with AHSA1/START domain